MSFKEFVVFLLLGITIILIAIFIGKSFSYLINYIIHLLENFI